MNFDTALDWVRERSASGMLPAAVLGIATADTVHELAAFGASGNRTTAVDDHFALFSITKAIVALAAMREVEAGRLALADELSSVLPEFGSGHRAPVTLEHLLTHTSGIEDPPLDTPRGLRRSLEKAGSLFRSGTMSRYSSIAFEGIAAMMEASSGRHWEHLVADVAADAGATGLTFDPVDPHPVFGIAEGDIDYDAFRRLRHPGAGLFGRADDLLALGRALLRNDATIVTPETLAEMRRPRTVGLPRLEPYPPEAGQDWGLAFNLRAHAPGLIDHDNFGHGGWSRCELWVYPSLGVCFALMANTAPDEGWGTEIDGLHNAIVGSFV